MQLYVPNVLFLFILRAKLMPSDRLLFYGKAGYY